MSVDSIARGLALLPRSAGVFYSAASEASIQSAASAANAAGGGVVKIPAGRITLTEPLPVYNGVIYEGTGWASDIRGSRTACKAGTILVGDGTFDGVDYHETDLGVAPTVYATFLDGMAYGFGLMRLGFENFAYGVKIGALYNPGMMCCYFEQLDFVNCQQWGMWVENYVECVFKDILANNCAVGGIARVQSGYTAMNGGNSRWYHTFVATPTSSAIARGIVSWARGTSYFNDEYTLGEQVNRGITAISQAATMANGSDQITVTDGTKFAVDMPVTVSSSVNGFVANETYFVRSIATNVLTLSRTVGYGTTVSATGNTAVNILSKGFSCFQFAGLDASSVLTGFSCVGLDAEGSCTVRTTLQNVRYSEILASYFEATGTNDYRTWVIRNSVYNRVVSYQASGVDGDTASSTTSIGGARSEVQVIDFTNAKLYGQGISTLNLASQKRKNGSAALSMQGINYPEIYLNADTNGVNIKNALTIDSTGVGSGGSITVGASVWVYTGGAGGTVTLMAISTHLWGTIIIFSNPTANSVTLATAGENFDNIAATTSMTVAANTTVIIQALDTLGTGSGTKYWAHLNG